MCVHARVCWGLVLSLACCFVCVCVCWELLLSFTCCCLLFSLFFLLTFWPHLTGCRILVPRPGIEPHPLTTRLSEVPMLFSLQCLPLPGWQAPTRFHPNCAVQVFPRQYRLLLLPVSHSRLCPGMTALVPLAIIIHLCRLSLLGWCLGKEGSYTIYLCVSRT